MHADSRIDTDPDDDDDDGCDGLEHADPSEMTSDEDLPPSQGGVADT